MYPNCVAAAGLTKLTSSGGERNRVHLAKTLTEGANVLLLDEPTNDLDVNTLRALEESLEEYAGVAVIVSHDRWFLDRIFTHIIAFEGESIAKVFIGNWSDYETGNFSNLCIVRKNIKPYPASIFNGRGTYHETQFDLAYWFTSAHTIRLYTSPNRFSRPAFVKPNRGVVFNSYACTANPRR